MYSHPSPQNHHAITLTAFRVTVLGRRIKASTATAYLLAELIYGAGREPKMPTSLAGIGGPHG